MKIILSLFLFLSVITANTQTTPDVIFKNLKNGAILVRLKTNSNSIKALKGNNDDLMERIIAKRDTLNKEIIDAFNTNFALCTVYYFYSDDSKYIAQAKFEGVLLDNELNKIKDIPILKDNYFIMEFSYLMQNTEKTWSYSEWGTRDGKAQNIDYYSGGNEKGPDALIVLMPNFRLVPNYYPYFTRTFERLPIIARSKARTVEKLQEKIESFIKLNYSK